MNLQQTVMQLQNEQSQLMSTFGLTQAKMAQFAQQLNPFMQSLMIDNTLTLEDTKAHFQLKS
jgi:hypothetical protein